MPPTLSQNRTSYWQSVNGVVTGRSINGAVRSFVWGVQGSTGTNGTNFVTTTTLTNLTGLLAGNGSKIVVTDVSDEIKADLSADLNVRAGSVFYWDYNTDSFTPIPYPAGGAEPYFLSAPTLYGKGGQIPAWKLPPTAIPLPPAEPVRYAGLLAAHLARQIDDRIAGKTPATDAPTLATRDDGTLTYTLNSSCWLAGVDLSWASVNGGALVSPLHLVYAAHTGSAIGATFRFRGTNGTGYSRTVVAEAQYLATDLVLLTLSSALPAAVVPVAVFPPGSLGADGFPLLGATVPAVVLDQDSLRSAELWEVRLSDEFTTYNDLLPVPTNRQPWQAVVEAGDSGNPVFLVVRDAAILLTTLYTTSGGPSAYGAGAYAWIRAAVEGAGYSLALPDWVSGGGGSGGGSGTVTAVSSGGASPLFTVSIANPTTTPTLTFTRPNVTLGGLVYAVPPVVAMGGASADFIPLDALHIQSGTFNVARIPVLPYAPTGHVHVAADITSGTFDIGRLPATVARTDADNLFGGSQDFLYVAVNGGLEATEVLAGSTSTTTLTVGGKTISGTNTGDQDLSGYAKLAGPQTHTGTHTFAGVVTTDLTGGKLIAFNNTAADEPVVKWNPTSSFFGLRCYSGATEVARFQDNGFVLLASLGTLGGLLIGDYYVGRGTSAGRVSFGFSGEGAVQATTGSPATAYRCGLLVGRSHPTKPVTIIEGDASHTGDLQQWNLSGGGVLSRVMVTGAFQPPAYTIATLPTASTHAGCQVRVTDATPAQRPAYSDGTAWRWVSDDVAV